jgi:hypothetical protein
MNLLVFDQLACCPRSVLDVDTVLYLTREEDRLPYAVTIDDGGILRPFLRPHETITTGTEGWIFVTKGSLMYANPKKTDTTPRIHHSTFFAGEPVDAAGLFVSEAGRLKRLFPHSGHYRPAERHLRRLLEILSAQNVDLSTVEVDVQRVMKVARQHERESPCFSEHQHCRILLPVSPTAFTVIDGVYVYASI